jgi:hypothetical protein
LSILLESRSDWQACNHRSLIVIMIPTPVLYSCGITRHSQERRLNVLGNRRTSTGMAYTPHRTDRRQGDHLPGAGCTRNPAQSLTPPSQRTDHLQDCLLSVRHTPATCLPQSLRSDRLTVVSRDMPHNTGGWGVESISGSVETSEEPVQPGTRLDHLIDHLAIAVPRIRTIHESLTAASRRGAPRSQVNHAVSTAHTPT